MIAQTENTESKSTPGLAIVTPKTITRRRIGGMNIAICEHSGIREYHISARPFAGESALNVFRRIAIFLSDHDAKIVRQEVFGSVGIYEPCERLLRNLFGAISWPLNWVDGESNESEIAGTHVLAIAGTEIESICHKGKAIATIFHDQWARHCLLGNLVPENVNASPAIQAENAYEIFQTGLAAAKMNVSDVVRTWFFLDDILSWYGEFNQVRNCFYARQDLRGKTFPASTGVSGKTRGGGALSFAAWAIQPLDSQTDFTEVSSPLQCPAPKYGSGFSRAAEMVTPEYRRLFVSGTASIFPDGRSAHEGDILKQIDLSMDVVRGILESRDLTFADVTRATLYFKNIAQAGAFNLWCAENGISFPAIATQATVCRDELLFEIELDAFSNAVPILPER